MRYNHRLHLYLHGLNQTRHQRHRLLSFVGLVVLIGLLALINRLHQINHHELYVGFMISLVRVSLAYFISAVLALGLALLATKNKFTEAIILPFLDVMQSFPSFALLPFLVVLLGHNGAAVVIILVIAMIWPILFSLIGAVKTERADLHDAAVLYGATGTKFLRYYQLPMILPNLMTGSIVAWGEAWDVLVGAEIIAAVAGIGSYLGNLSEDPSKLASLFLGIGVYLLFIFVINEIIWLPLLRYSARYQSD